MKVSISQPTLFPWIGYFNIIKNADVFVFLDNVKFQKSSWHMRNRLKSKSKVNDEEFWIYIPTKITKSHTPIKDVLIDNDKNWQQRHLDNFQHNYRGNYEKIHFLHDFYNREWVSLVNFNIEFISECCKYLNISTKLIRASEMNVVGNKSHLVLDICKQLKAEQLLANKGSENYLEEDKHIFEKENISISYHSYRSIPYNQKGKVFLENLSVLDLLFSEKENARHYI